jgi:hypothetical protein
MELTVTAKGSPKHDPKAEPIEPVIITLSTGGQ